MKTKIFGGIAILAIAVAVAFNVTLSNQKQDAASMLALANVEALAQSEWDYSYLWNNPNQSGTSNYYLKIDFRKEVRSNINETHVSGTETTSPKSTTVYYGELSGSYFGAGFIVGGEGSVKRTEESGVTRTFDITTTSCELSYVDATCCYVGGFEPCTPDNC